MNCLLVPTLAYDLSLLDRLDKSIDYPIKNKVVINNGCKEFISVWEEEHPDWYVINLPENIGVAASWNLAPKLWPFEDSWLICNDDQQFQPGALEVISHAANQHTEAPIIYVNEFEAYDVFVWTREGVEEIGYFDENFYPAYFEDYEYRMRISAAQAVPFSIPAGLSVNHGRVKPAGPRYTAMLNACKPINEDYLKDKWGGVQERKFEFPWDIPQLELQHWTMEYKRRSMLKAHWDEFWNNTPSVYE